MNQLEVLRESLGQCDEIILDALLMRNRIVEDIMVYKEANNLPVLQPEQEAKQKGWLEARMEGRRHKKEVNDVFASIIQNSKRIQSRNLFNYNIFSTQKKTCFLFLLHYRFMTRHKRKVQYCILYLVPIPMMIVGTR